VNILGIAWTYKNKNQLYKMKLMILSKIISRIIIIVGIVQVKIVFQQIIISLIMVIVVLSIPI
jgi:hypothetical protein